MNICIFKAGSRGRARLRLHSGAGGALGADVDHADAQLHQSDGPVVVAQLGQHGAVAHVGGDRRAALSIQPGQLDHGGDHHAAGPGDGGGTTQFGGPCRRGGDSQRLRGGGRGRRGGGMRGGMPAGGATNEGRGGGRNRLDEEPGSPPRRRRGRRRTGTLQTGYRTSGNAGGALRVEPGPGRFAGPERHAPQSARRTPRTATAARGQVRRTGTAPGPDAHRRTRRATPLRKRSDRPAAWRRTRSRTSRPS